MSNLIRWLTGKVSNTITQSGNVILSFEKDDNVFGVREKHNSATLDLCKYVRDALTGGENIYYRRPYKIRAINKDGTVLEASSYFEVSSMSTAAADNVLSLFFKLQYDLIAGLDIYGFNLYSANSDGEHSTVYATVSYGDNPIKGSELTANTNIRVEWQLKVSKE